MKIVSLILGILLTASGAFCLFMSALAGIGYISLMDGTAEMYRSYASEFRVFLIAGLILLALGILSLVLRKKKFKKTA